MDDFRHQIESVQADNEKLSERIAALEVAQQTDANKAPGDKAREGKRPPVRQVIELGSGSDQARSKADERGQDGPMTEVRIDRDGVPVVRVSKGSAQRRQRARDQRADRTYRRAVDQMNDKRYDDAIKNFAWFLARYPDHPKADGAMYWRGECYYAQGDYLHAAEHFQAVIDRYPKGNKVADAMLKLGRCQRAMGDKVKAAKTFETLRKEFPNSDAARKIPRE